MLPLLIAAAVSIGASPSSAARQLFLEVEHAVTSPKSIRCEVRVTGLAEKAKLVGSLLMAEGNRVRAEQTVTGTEGRELASLVVCDGRNRGGRQTRPGEKPTIVSSRRPSTQTAELTRLGLVRGGWIDAFIRANGPDDRADTRVLLMGFYEPPDISLLSVHQEKNSTVLTYSLGPTSVFGGQGSRVRLWIDPETNLPKKRVITSRNRSGDDLVVTETYTHWEIDADPRATMFVVPK